MSLTLNGSGSIDGLSPGGLTDQTVTPSELTQPLTLMTAKSATGTSVDFDNIPAWVKRVTLLLAGVSTTGASYMLVQIGSSAGLVTTNYNGTSSVITTGVDTYSSTIGFPIRDNPVATRVNSGHFTLVLLSGNLWVSSHVMKSTTGTTCLGAGDVTLPGTLDRIRITTVNGTDSFDAGTINVMYEG